MTFELKGNKLCLEFGLNKPVSLTNQLIFKDE